MDVKESKKRARNHNRFVSSMTFASVGTTCDCDECGIRESVVPPSFALAVTRYKKSRPLSENVPTFQERNLVARDGGVSIWRLVLPPGSEPITEFGNSHRIVFVESMPVGRSVRSIGKGIIGSGDEKKSRQKVYWEDKHAYLYKSNGGKAVGWVNQGQPTDNELNIDDTDNDIVLYVLKATKNALALANTKDTNAEYEQQSQREHYSWVHKLNTIFNTYIGDNVSNIEKLQHESSNAGNVLPMDDAVSIEQLLNTVI